MRIRPYQAGDKDAVIALVNDTLQEIFGVPGHGLDDLHDIPRNYRHGVFLVAEDENAIIGTAATYPVDGKTWRLKRMYVRTHARGTGTARQLLEAVERYAKEHGAERMMLTTTSEMTAAHRFYEKHGYRKTDDHPPTYEKEL